MPGRDCRGDAPGADNPDARSRTAMPNNEPTEHDAGQTADIESLRAELERQGQDHLLRFHDPLEPEAKRALRESIAAIPWPVLEPLIGTHVLGKPAPELPEDIEPAPVYSPSVPPAGELSPKELRAIGESELRAGRVAAFTVAGGQGTRLGVDGPKGCVPVTPVGNLTLFELFARMVLSARTKYDVAIPWYVMTSRENDAETRTYFKANDYFGLPPEDVVLFPQRMLPVFDLEGRILLASKHEVALAPDGHGGSLKALADSGAIADMQRRGISIVSYFQVDNPLVMPFDPLFVGLHTQTGSEMSTKVTRKADDLERVGNLCRADGKVRVIEYSEFPEELAVKRNAKGNRMFDAANLAVHLIDVAFLDRIVGGGFELPFRRAEKAVPFIDDDGNVQRPDGPNAVKLETFVFDALPLAKRAALLEVDRSEEFAPVKNATGVDSLETSQAALVRRSARWLEAAGITVPRTQTGELDCNVVISPSFALSEDDIAASKGDIPQISAGDELLLR